MLSVSAWFSSSNNFWWYDRSNLGGDTCACNSSKTKVLYCLSKTKMPVHNNPLLLLSVCDLMYTVTQQ